MSVRENIAKNIVLLRKSYNWKQSDLAERLHYTDKAISKWERGESTPDVESLAEIARIFNVPVDFLFEDNHDIPEFEDKNTKFIRAISGFVILATTFYLIATVVFVYNFIIDSPNKVSCWVAFIWATFISMAAAYVLVRMNKYKKAYPYLASACIWLALTTGYCQSLVLGENVWMVFLIGIPLQIGVVINKLIHRRS